MKNNYFKEIERAAKYIAKSDLLILQREGNTVYICNGHILVKVDTGLYNYSFRTVSPRYIPLEDEKTARANTKKQLPEECSRYEFTKLIPEKEEVVLISNYKMETANEKELRVCFLPDERLYIDEDYYKNLKAFNQSGVWFGTSRIKPIVSDFDLDVAVMLLPVNYQDYDQEYNVYSKESIQKYIKGVA